MSAAPNPVTAFATRAPGWAMFLAVSLVLLVFNLPFLSGAGGPYSHVLLADAFAHGRLDIATATADSVLFQGRNFVPAPPFPAVVLLPFAALFGAAFKTLLLTPFLGGATAAILFGVLRRTGTSAATAAWLAAGFVFGSVYWPTVRLPGSTGFAHVVAVLCLLLALREAMGRQRGFIVGFLAGFACLSREFSVFALPFLWALLAWHAPAGRSAGRRWASVLVTGIGLAACVAAYAWYNWARFGAPGDDGTRYLEEEGWSGFRQARWGSFHWVYIVPNLLRLVVGGFPLELPPPGHLVPEIAPWGMSLIFASPFVLYAMFGRPGDDRRLRVAGGLSIVAGLGAVLAHRGAVGSWQSGGAAFALDFLPVALVFAAAGMERWAATPWRRLWQGAIVYAVAMNLLTLVLPLLARLQSALVGPLEP